jgi:hypothetical protein
MQIRTLALRELNLDPRNPRLGLRNSEAELPQDAILEMMEDWALEELAISFLESGYWPQEALLVVREPIYGAEGNIVVEGNRRLAALILLYRAFHGRAAGRKWAELVEGRSEPVGLFENIELQPCRERRECQRTVATLPKDQSMGQAVKWAAVATAKPLRHSSRPAAPPPLRIVLSYSARSGISESPPRRPSRTEFVTSVLP